MRSGDAPRRRASWICSGLARCALHPAFAQARRQKGDDLMVLHVAGCGEKPDNAGRPCRCGKRVTPNLTRISGRPELRKMLRHQGREMRRFAEPTRHIAVDFRDSPALGGVVEVKPHHAARRGSQRSLIRQNPSAKRTANPIDPAAAPAAAQSPARRRALLL